MDDLTLQDLILDTKDEIGNYSTGVTTDDRVIRAINRSMEYLKRALGFPSDEKLYQFQYSQDQIFIDVPDDFDETILIRYLNETYNVPGYGWQYFTYPDVLRQVGLSPDFLYSFTTINGRKQLVMVGHNTRQGSTVDVMDVINHWVAGGDASNLRLDTYKKVAGAASLEFDLARSTGVGYIETTGTWTFQDLFLNDGFFKFWTYLTNNGITAISLKLFTDSSNYYTITSTVADDGTDFSLDQFIKVGFNVDDAVATLAPNPASISKIRIEYDLPVGFISSTAFRANLLFTTFPDMMKLGYYSSYKGTNSDGDTEKTILTDPSDIVAIGAYFPDYRTLIAERAALRLWSQLKGDRGAYQDLMTRFTTDMKAWGRVYPRKRTQINSFSTKLRR